MGSISFLPYFYPNILQVGKSLEYVSARFHCTTCNNSARTYRSTYKATWRFFPTSQLHGMLNPRAILRRHPISGFGKTRLSSTCRSLVFSDGSFPVHSGISAVVSPAGRELITYGHQPRTEAKDKMARAWWRGLFCNRNTNFLKSQRLFRGVNTAQC